MIGQSNELSIWRFGFLAAVTYIIVRIVIDTFIIPINWNWLGLLMGAIVFAVVFAAVLKRRGHKNKLNSSIVSPRPPNQQLK